MQKTENYELLTPGSLEVAFHENMHRIDAELKRLDEKSGDAGGGTSGDLPWCSGTFADKALPANTYVAITPIAEKGDSTMIKGDTFVAPEDGLYQLSCYGGSAATNCNVFSIIKLNSFSQEWRDSATLDASQMVNNTPIPPSNITKRLNKGEYLINVLQATVAQSTIKDNNQIRRFTFARIG